MCSHSWYKVNDVTICAKCGVTLTFDGKLLFDRKIVNYKSKRKAKKK